MLESVFEIRKQTGLVEKLRGLKPTEAPAKFFFGLIRDGLEQRKRKILANNGCGLKKMLLLRWKPVDASGKHRLHRGRHLGALDRFGKPIISSLARQNFCFDECPDTFFQEERISFGSVDQ